MISPSGQYSTQLLGGSLEHITEGAAPQVVVEGGVWKAPQLIGNYCLIGEGVAPGFDFDDFKWGTLEELEELVTEEKASELKRFLKNDPSRDFDRFYGDKEK